MWVVVEYERQKYLGKLRKKEIDVIEKYTVECLTKPFPIPLPLNRSVVRECTAYMVSQGMGNRCSCQQVQIDENVKPSKRNYYTY